MLVNYHRINENIETTLRGVSHATTAQSTHCVCMV